jgi:hypothetical protein
MAKIIGLFDEIYRLSKPDSLIMLSKLQDPKLVLARHSCEGRNPDLFESRQWRDWIPGYAGMTEKQLFEKPNGLLWKGEVEGKS